MKKIVSVILVIAMTAALCLGFAGCGNTAKYTVGICEQMEHPALANATKGFKDALIAALGEENIKFLEQNAQGDLPTCTTIAADYVTKKVDLILANATGALQACANATAGTSIPVLGTSVTEYGVALGIENFNGLVGTNVSGTSDLASLEEQAKMIMELYPEAKKVGMIYCSSEANSGYQVQKVTEYLTAQGVTCTDYKFTDSSDAAAVCSAAAAASDVLFVPTDNTAAACAEAINAVVLPTGTPIIGGDAAMCASMCVVTMSIDYYDLGKATGEMAAKILTGEAKVSEMEIGYAEASKLYNPTNCKALGLDTEALEAAGFTAIAAE